MSYFKGLLVVIAFSGCQSRHDQLEENIDLILSRQAGTFSVALSDLTTNEKLLIRPHEVFHAASTMKVPVMIEVYKQAAAGKFDLSDSLLIKNEFKSIVDGSPFSLDIADDSEQQLYGKTGSKQALSSLVYEMIIVSSNLATNTIMEWVGARDVTATMRSLGAKDILVLRGVEDTKAFEQGLSNTTTAYDLMLIFEKMAKGEIVDEPSCQAMIDILLDQRFNTIIPAKLPDDVKVAHKTGSITGVHHDAGIVFLPNGRKYVLVLLAKDLKDEDAAIAAMADVSRLIYDYVAHDE